MRRSTPVIVVLLLGAASAASAGEAGPSLDEVYGVVAEAYTHANRRQRRALDDAHRVIEQPRETLSEHIRAAGRVQRRLRKRFRGDESFDDLFDQAANGPFGLAVQVQEFGLPPLDFILELSGRERVRAGSVLARTLRRIDRFSRRAETAHSSGGLARQYRALSRVQREQERFREKNGLAVAPLFVPPDHDGDGVPDRCDQRTYDFQSDAVGQMPADVTQLGGNTPALVVNDLGGVAGERGVAYGVYPSIVSYDRLERVQADMPQQDTTVYLDVGDGPGVFSIELWSEGSSYWGAGSGLIFQVEDDGDLLLYERDPVVRSPVPAGALPLSGRLRLRLVKGSGTDSALHVDTWDGIVFQEDATVVAIADDGRFRGRGVVLADWLGGERALERITTVHEVPDRPLTIARAPEWSQDWQLFQRDSDGVATIPVRALYRLGGLGRLHARVVVQVGGAVLTGHDWADHEVTLAAAANGSRRTLEVEGVPTGGNYDVEVRLLDGVSGEVVLGQDVLASVAVGDVWLAGGQSNMSGWSGSLEGAEPPIDEIHLFHNDGAWRRASEPMDESTGQVDPVSSDGRHAQHSPMLSFAKGVYAATGVPIAVIPGPLGATNLFGHWQRDEDEHANRGTLYGSLLSRSLRQSTDEPPVGLIWMQGEHDALNSRTTTEYVSDLQELIARYREDLENGELHVVVGQLGMYSSANVPKWLAIHEAQRLAARADERVTLATTVNQPRADPIHFSVAGYRVVGSWFAEAALAGHYGHALDHLTELMSATASLASDSIELLYDATVSGGAAELFRVTDATGDVPVALVATDGVGVTLSLGRPLSGDATVSYGYSVWPSAAWITDSAGRPVPLFSAVAVDR